MTAATQPRRGAFLAPLFLFVMATLIPELLIGSTPVSRLNQLVFQFPYYGSAALVIREAVVRLRLGRAGLVLLGVAFGLVTEGLSLQSVFNPHFLNLDIAFGRAGDVNWPWTYYMVGYHALWSITIPVTLAGLVFRERQDEPWLGRVGLGIFLVLFVLMAFAFHALFVKLSGFRAPTLPYVGAALAAAALIVIALQLKRRDGPGAPRSTSTAYVTGLLTLLFGLIWLGLYSEIFRASRVLPAGLNLAAGLGLAGAAVLLARRLARPGDSARRLAFVGGGLFANTLFGFVVVSATGVRLDLYAQGVLLLLVAAGLHALGRRQSAGRA